jgi:hypothetical protein
LVSREEIAWAYRLLFGREPESEQAYAAHSGLADLNALRRALIGSHEGQYRLSTDLRDLHPPVDFDFYRPLLVFLHIEKTGGTSLYEMVSEAFPAGRASEPHLSRIPAYSLGELNRYDFISGHFTWPEAMALPRATKTCIALFRDPADRLVSFYRFLRAHPPKKQAGGLPRLAQELDPVSFFGDASVRRDVRMFNNYVHVLAGLPADPDDRNADALEAQLALAIDRVDQLAAVGVTEDMAGSVRLVFDRIGLVPPAEIARLHVTDEIHRHAAEFREAEPVEPSFDLDEAIAPLIEYDQRLHAHVRRRFATDLISLDRQGSDRVTARLAAAFRTRMDAWRQGGRDAG